jgi:hypothetical protein
MKAYVGVDVYIYIFLTSALAGGEWSASSPYRFTPGERAHGAHWAGEPVLMTWRSKNSCPHRDSNSDLSVFQPVAIPTTLSRLIICKGYIKIRKRRLL